MAYPLDLIVPTPDDFVLWKGVETVNDLEASEESVTFFLRLAADLLILATEITEAPDPDTSLGRVVTAGICDMAWYIGTSLESRDEQFSPFSSERIGSYSYSKAATAASNGTDTGVPFFDNAVKFLLKNFSDTDLSGVSYDSEYVFKKPFETAPVFPTGW